jgi:hypothetical protein
VPALMQKCLCWSRSHSVVLQLSIHWMIKVPRFPKLVSKLWGELGLNRAFQRA